MKTPRIAFLTLPAVLVLAIETRPFGSGSYTATTTRTTPSCGSCHTTNPGGATVGITVSSRSLPVNSTATIGVSVSGPAGTAGGFAGDISTGTLSAGTNTTIQSPTAITHANNSVRSWSFGFTAPATAGLVEFYAVAMGSNGTGSTGDSWAFHGTSATATTSTPVRIYANPLGVTSIGSSCVGSFGNFPVLGVRQAPTVGNASFAVELHGAAPSSAAGLIIGESQATTPINLAQFGITGCQLFINPCALPCQPRVTSTGSGNAARSEGSATFAVPIPNNTRLRGLNVFSQAFFADAQFGSSRVTKFTFTNALRVTIQ